jgi:hypothetical protein
VPEKETFCLYAALCFTVALCCNLMSVMVHEIREYQPVCHNHKQDPMKGRMNLELTDKTWYNILSLTAIKDSINELMIMLPLQSK